MQVLFREVFIEPREFSAIGCRNRSDVVAQFHNLIWRIPRPMRQPAAIGIACQFDLKLTFGTGGQDTQLRRRRRTGRGDREFFRSVEAAVHVQSLYSRADERFTIFVCRDIHPPFDVLWPRIKAW